MSTLRLRSDFEVSVLVRVQVLKMSTLRLRSDFGVSNFGFRVYGSGFRVLVVKVSTFRVRGIFHARCENLPGHHLHKIHT